MSRWAKLKALEKEPRLMTAPSLRVIVGGPLVGPDTVMVTRAARGVTVLLGTRIALTVAQDFNWRLKLPDGTEIAVGQIWGATIEPWNDAQHSSLLKEATLGVGATSYQSAPWDTPVPPGSVR